MNKKISFLSIVFLAALFQGCSARLSESAGAGDDGDNPDGTTPVTQSNFQNLVAGPSLDGIWKSPCIQSDRYFGEYEVITLNITGQNVLRQSATYADAACTSLDTPRTQTESGLVRFDTSSVGGNYGLEYQFNLTGLPSGVTGTYSAYENVRLDGAFLYVTDEIGGAAVPTIVLTRN